MSESAVAIVQDAEGLVHYASRYSKFIQDGLADGTLTEVEEAQDAADAAPSDDPDTGPVKRGSRHGEPRARAGHGDGHESVAESAVDS